MKKKNSLSALATILILIVGICGLCGRCGKSDTNQTSVTNPNPTPLKLDYSTSEPQALAKTLTSSPTIPSSKKVKSKRSATVISENANLRKTADQSGEVIELSSRTRLD